VFLGSYSKCRVESKLLLYFFKTLLGKDSKAAYQEFKDVFSFFDTVMKEGLPGSIHGPQIMPMIIWSSQDLSSVCKSLGTGSGARKSGDTHWCHLCLCTGNTIAHFTMEKIRYVDATLVS
jgi:hypothetical protein